MAKVPRVTFSLTMEEIDNLVEQGHISPEFKTAAEEAIADIPNNSRIWGLFNVLGDYDEYMRIGVSKAHEVPVKAELRHFLIK